MEKKTVKYEDLEEIQQLKLKKVFKLNKRPIKELDGSNVIFEGHRMKYVVVGDEIIDLF